MRPSEKVEFPSTPDEIIAFCKEHGHFDEVYFSAERFEVNLGHHQCSIGPGEGVVWGPMRHIVNQTAMFREKYFLVVDMYAKRVTRYAWQERTSPVDKDVRVPASQLVEGAILTPNGVLPPGSLRPLDDADRKYWIERIEKRLVELNAYPATDDREFVSSVLQFLKGGGTL